MAHASETLVGGGTMFAITICSPVQSGHTRETGVSALPSHSAVISTSPTEPPKPPAAGGGRDKPRFCVQVVTAGPHALAQVDHLLRETCDLSRSTVAWSLVDESRSITESCRAACRV